MDEKGTIQVPTLISLGVNSLEVLSFLLQHLKKGKQRTTTTSTMNKKTDQLYPKKKDQSGSTRSNQSYTVKVILSILQGSSLTQSNSSKIEVEEQYIH